MIICFIKLLFRVRGILSMSGLTSYNTNEIWYLSLWIISQCIRIIVGKSFKNPCNLAAQLISIFPRLGPKTTQPPTSAGDRWWTSTSARASRHGHPAARQLRRHGEGQGVWPTRGGGACAGTLNGGMRGILGMWYYSKLGCTHTIYFDKCLIAWLSGYLGPLKGISG